MKQHHNWFSKSFSRNTLEPENPLVYRYDEQGNLIESFKELLAPVRLRGYVSSILIYSSLAASAATWPAKAVTNVLNPVIADISANSPFSTALRVDVMSAAVV